MKDLYTCKRCGDRRGFYPEYYPSKEHYPTICPICSMPLKYMLQDIYRTKGLTETLRRLWIRVTHD